jgi:hypothetical protein
MPEPADVTMPVGGVAERLADVRGDVAEDVHARVVQHLRGDLEERRLLEGAEGQERLEGRVGRCEGSTFSGDRAGRVGVRARNLEVLTRCGGEDEALVEHGADKPGDLDDAVVERGRDRRAGGRLRYGASLEGCRADLALGESTDDLGVVDDGSLVVAELGTGLGVTGDGGADLRVACLVSDHALDDLSALIHVGSDVVVLDLLVSVEVALLGSRSLQHGLRLAECAVALLNLTLDVSAHDGATFRA